MSSTGSARSRQGRISRSGDFKRAYREGRSRANRFVVIYAFARSDTDREQIRLGVSVGRKVGNAVVRNRVKRVIREAFWTVADGLPSSHDFVIVARADSDTAIEGIDQAELAGELAELAKDAAGGSE